MKKITMLLMMIIVLALNISAPVAISQHKGEDNDNRCVIKEYKEECINRR